MHPVYWAILAATIITVYFQIISLVKCYSEDRRIFPSLRYVLFLNTKIKGGNMVVTMNNRQQLTGEVSFTNRRGEPATVQPGSVEYSLKDENGGDVPAEVATIEKNPDTENQFSVTTGATVTGRVLCNVHVKADADLDDPDVREISGDVLGIVIEQLEAANVSAAVVVEPHDI